MNKKDFVIVTIAGALIGLFALLPVKNILADKGMELTSILGIVIILGCLIFAPIALFVLKLLSGKFSIFERFGKFAAVGTLNTVLDLSVLNALTIFSGLSGGLPFFGFKAISFLCGTTNSYFWNKFWTFQSKTMVTFSEYLRFALFTLVGALINASVAYGARTFVFSSLSEGLAVNFAGLVAVAVSFIFNFLMYNNIVFKKQKSTESNSTME